MTDAPAIRRARDVHDTWSRSLGIPTIGACAAWASGCQLIDRRHYHRNLFSGLELPPTVDRGRASHRRRSCARDGTRGPQAHLAHLRGARPLDPLRASRLWGRQPQIACGRAMRGVPPGNQATGRQWPPLSTHPGWRWSPGRTVSSARHPSLIWRAGLERSRAPRKPYSGTGALRSPWTWLTRRRARQARRAGGVTMSSIACAPIIPRAGPSPWSQCGDCAISWRPGAYARVSRISTWCTGTSTTPTSGRPVPAIEEGLRGPGRTFLLRAEGFHYRSRCRGAWT